MDVALIQVEGGSIQARWHLHAAVDKFSDARTLSYRAGLIGFRKQTRPILNGLEMGSEVSEFGH